ncbi:GldG family protein [Leptospira mayottensis]|uniref:GldG family protein n=1 Tax=Leptospira mayottensis TaxID=1137606 RepID=UPI0002BDA149|nr:GldG family protein [Leptospira mayottensis]AXR61573.1 gliding motility ABC transporter [Leptospira mayottensis]AZQ01986.1 gliding motility ABC transporter [Leptospira mayottensis 200901116]TGN13597.1 gliding motility ABC transporter [Leptospira mayottensis]
MISNLRIFFSQFNSNPWFLFSQAFLLFLFSNGILSQFVCRKDLSESERFEVSESTRKIFQNLHSPIYIDAYYSSKTPGEYKTRLDLTKELLSEIASLGGSNAILRFHDPDFSVEEQKKAIEAGIQPQILEKTELGSSQIKQAYFGLTLTLGTRKETIPIAFYAEEIEYQILTTLRKMIRSPTDSGIGILSIPGALSTTPSDPEIGKDTIGIFANQILIEEYGALSKVRLEEEDIQDSLHTLLWIGGGTLSETAFYKLDQFLMRGGNLILLFKSMDFRLEPPNREKGIGINSIGAGIAKPTPRIEEQNRIFESYGFRVNTDLVLDPNRSLSIGPLMEVEPGVIGRYAYPPWILAGSSQEMLSEVSPFTKPLKNLLLPWVSSLTLFPDRQPNVRMEPILLSSEEAEIRSSVVALGEKQIFATPIRSGNKKIILGAVLEGSFRSAFASVPTVFKKSNPFLKQTSEGKISRILAIGSPYLVSDLLAYPETRKIYQESNIPFLLNALDISAGDTDLIQIRGKKSAFLKLNPFSNTEKITFSFLNLLGIPSLLGLYTYLRMRYRNSLRGKDPES